MKGMMHTLEAVLGSVLVLVGIMMIFPVQQISEINFSEIGHSCLNYLDQNGLLRYYTINNMNTELNDSLKVCLSAVANFKFKICSTSDCIDNSIPYDKTVYLSSYLIAGENTYNRKLINLWTWSK
jgi:hypothetical protein